VLDSEESDENVDDDDGAYSSGMLQPIDVRRVLLQIKGAVTTTVTTN